MADDMDTPASGSPLSDIDSDEFAEEKFTARSRSNSQSTISASSDGSITPSTSTPRHRDMHPAKRRRTGASTYDHLTPQSGLVAPGSPSGSISSDSSGSVPTSPSFAHLGPTHPLSTAYAAAQANPENPDLGDYMQVTRCLWKDCPTPEQGNMDNLVAHINDFHIVPRQKKYFCEWEDCGRKAATHTSAYALKAHMRSHTKEKPFLCQLPECDRSFTRSDALAKHMRTVHETEALRPSDPVPKGHTGGISNGVPTSNGPKRLKLIMGGSVKEEKRLSIIGDLPPLPRRKYSEDGVAYPSDQEFKSPDQAIAEAPAQIKPYLRVMGDRLVPFDPSASDQLYSNNTKAPSPDDMRAAEQYVALIDAIDMDSVPFELPIPEEYYPAEVYEDMDDYELTLPPSQYFRLLRRQIHWAEEEGTELVKELEDARATTETIGGVPFKRGAGDEKGADDNRRLEWQQAEAILDALLRAETDQVWEMFTGKKGVEEGADQNPWQMIKGLEGLVGGAP